MNFQPGMEVYYPAKSHRIHTLVLREDKEDSPFPLLIEGLEPIVTVTEKGLYTRKDLCPSIFLATEVNQRHLNNLYGITFESPFEVFQKNLLKHFESNKDPVVVRDTTGQLLFVTGAAKSKAFLQGGVQDLRWLRPYSPVKPFLIVDGT